MLWKRLLIVPALAVGLGAFWYLNSAADAPNTIGDAPAVPVRTLTVSQGAVGTTAKGYGRVRAVRRWEAVSEVSGRVVAVSPDLEEGSFIAAGAVYVTIDPSEFEIAKARAEAALVKARAARDELAAQESAVSANLALETQMAELAQADRARKRELVARGTVSQLVVDQAERDALTQARRVQDLQNEVALIAVQRISAKADIQSRIVDLEDAERDLANTKLIVPFDGRVADETVEVGEYVRSGDSLAEIDDVAAAEVTAEFQPRALHALAAITKASETFQPVSLGATGAAAALIEEAGLRAVVIQDIGGIRTTWPAEVLRSNGSVDEKTGTVGIVVRVEDPLRLHSAQQGVPLNVGTFVTVELRTRPTLGLITVPRDAIRTAADGVSFVYVVEADDTLGRREVDMLAPTGADVVVDGLAPGERVVLSPPQPPVMGMPLLPIADDTPREVTFG